MTLLAKRYASALFLAARDANAVDAVGEGLEVLHGALQDPDVHAAVTSPDSAYAMRRNVLEKLTQGRHQLVGNLAHVVLARHREAMLPDLYPAWRELVMADRNEVDGVVESPRPLGEEDLGALGDLATRLSGKKVNLSLRLQPDLIGGVRLQVGNELYDGSVKTVLEQLQRQLLEAPL